MSDLLLGKPIRQQILSSLSERIAKGEKITGYVIYNEASFEAGAYAKLIGKLLTNLNQQVKEIIVKDALEAKKAIDEANRDPLGSVFLCRPLLFKEEKELIELIHPEKDADMLTSLNLGKLTKGNLDYLSGTSSSVRKILEYYHLDPKGQKALIVGRSVSVGMPCALMMIKKDALVSVVHTKVEPEVISQLAKESTYIILASGHRGLVKKEDIRPQQIIIDCGYQEDGGGDLGFIPDCLAYTPVPGGVGPVTIAALAENAFKLLYGNEQ
ncbi:MAG: bifunctional 5,10-methylenetetrahydrofolate dehydrogenase/5,10-methenyltetrahydrofolate cyclohydrolase [Bacilli bacterium]|jgi:methylenetetrahydrofolate dehydrogenase (NADP+)/methenyltetrahydrofolate cyclohydrolase|nr:bifunctional 5,10-methylenetetrahydrofolate dehydrogenase/5,10-methenyltetrahydrofolate cyclohydrolase [Bacilli bacterium]